MGILTSDPLTYLIKEYGEDVCKYLVAIKADEFVEDKAPTFKEKIQQQFKNTAKNLDQEFDNKEATIKNNFDSVIGSIKQSNAAALESAKASQNKTQEQLFGFDSFQQKIKSLKSAKDGKVKEQQDNVLKIFEEKKTEIQKQINEKKPSLPLFDQMPICLRQKVLSEGQEKFAPQIKEQQEKVMGVFQNLTNVKNLEEQIKKAVGLGEIDKMVKDSNTTFEKAKKMITALSSGKMGRSCFG